MEKPIVISEELREFLKISKWNLNSNHNQYKTKLTYFYINIEEDYLPFTCSAIDISVRISPENEISKPFLKELTFLTLLNFFKRKERDSYCRCIYMHLTRDQIETNFTKKMFDDLGIKFLFSYMGNHDNAVYVFNCILK